MAVVEYKAKVLLFDSCFLMGEDIDGYGLVMVVIIPAVVEGVNFPSFVMFTIQSR